jgi:rSAM/selenodomain-associated transferase 2
MEAIISIIIPALNEGRYLDASLAALDGVAGIEPIVVDGGSRDNTREIAAAAGARVITTPPGRALQMNAGAGAARGDLLLFLHADSILPTGFADCIRQTLIEPQVAAGAFRLTLDAPGLAMRILERLIYWRSICLQMVYGDQALFMTMEMFQARGGFPVMPIMEDFEFIRRLRRRGRIAIVPRAVTTSARRWQRLGLIRTTVTNQLIIAAYLFGVDPGRLARWYRGSDGGNAGAWVDRPG